MLGLRGRDAQKTQHGIETVRMIRGVVDRIGRDAQKTQHGIETLCSGQN